MKIILSCNEDPIYSEFWPVVAAAYKVIFPHATVHLALLTNRTDEDPVVQEARTHGMVTLFPVLPDIPQFGQAKMIRFILAAQQEREVCYVDDIDLFPLSESFITTKLNRRPDFVLLCVGGEVYGFNGCYPISQMTAEGYIWKRFINPRDETPAECLRSWKDKAFYDHRENIMIQPEWDASVGGFKNDHYFSDERLLKRLLVENPVPKIEIQRGYSDYLDATIDRATVKNGVWEYDRGKLANGGYVNAHCARPYSQYKEQMEPLINYVKEKYK